MIEKFLKNKIISQNEKLLKLYTVFGLPPSQLLPPSRPRTLPPPFEFHSSNNQDISYISSPRLSITKLLTSSWCELRDYYEVYSGSIRTTNESLKLGSKYHEALELEDFEVINIDLFEEFLKSLPDIRRPDPKEPTENFFYDTESKLSNDWFESIILRLFNLLTKGDTRELLVHDYLDLKTCQFQNTDDSVMVSGIIDYIKLLNPSDHGDFSLFEEVQLYLELNPNYRLNTFLDEVQDLVTDHNYELKFTDIKTRQINQIPAQQSVLMSAYLQVCYYKYFFENLARDPSETYQMLLKNARVRHCDLDKPIDIRLMLSLLRKYPDLLLDDFKSLANGSFKSFEPIVATDYDLTNLITEKDIQNLNEIDDFDYNRILNREILTKWEIPLTLRYFAQISSKFYHVFKPFKCKDISIEYHNVRTNLNFQTVEYQFDQAKLNESIESSAKFWNGEKIPKGVKNLGKCKYCDFNTRCPVPNKDLKNIGWELTKFLNQPST
ncbi:exonuclease V, mitochondrial [[Candida] jaroonii]|uniref:Exonuclease V, mitochondrial n=1 Tax=[Candida] jaroonii TaxID=467808 RepID=A0ACA9YA05_9ASCO|nr:exonuclease V, mitochondrial [[Candida] jaroonii]